MWAFLVSALPLAVWATLACSLVSLAAAWWLYRRSQRLLDAAVNAETKRARAAKRAATYPQHYPAGWYRLLDSSELKTGDVREIEALGEMFVVFRGDDGKAGVLEAYCPHLGANFAHGGRVKGNSVVCPFHLWTFDKTGACSSIPYSDNVPTSLKAKSWTVKEVYGMIFVYYTAAHETNGDMTPPYEIPDDIVKSDWSKLGSYSTEVDMHLQEFAENSVDFQHFHPIHGQLRIPFTNIPIPGCKIVHKAHWDPSTEEGSKHIARFYDEAYLNIFGTHADKTTKMQASITFLGPGGVVYFTFHTPLGPVVLFMTHTPTTLTHLRVKFHFFSSPSAGRLLGLYVCGNWISQWIQDLVIWENKIFRSKPFLVKEDGPVKKLRQWYNQFYPNHKCTTLEW